MIECYKYNSVRSASFVLAELLKRVMPAGYVIVPLPTIRRHVRERGFDHIGLICQKTGCSVEKVLRRRRDTVQVGANREQRMKQALEAYGAKGVIPDEHYLLVDDVWTTGSSMMAACEAMRSAGAKNLAIAVIARSNQE